MKRNYVLISIAAVIAVLVVIKILRKSTEPKGNVVQSAAVIVKAECYLARDTIINFPVKTVGFLRANEQVDIVAEIAKRVLGISFKEGGIVKKGDILFRLDDAELRAEQKKAASRLALARDNEKRNRALLESGGISQQTYDESLNNLNIIVSEAEYIQVQLDKTLITAPFSGRAGLRNVSIGAYVSPGMILTHLEDLSQLKLDFSVPESLAASVKAGDKLSFTIEGMKGSHDAWVEAVEPSVERSSGNLRVRALIRYPDNSLIPGVSVSVSLNLHSNQPCLYLPTQALIPTPAGYSVYLLQDGKAKPQKVMAGLRTEKMIEIREGISPGDSVLVSGLLKIRPDTRIKIIKTW